MKRLFFLFLVALSCIASAQKAQDADTLVWNSRRYAVVVEPYVPSVLMVYYQCTGNQSPFNFWSSNNNRGHVATYEILNDALYLHSIEAKRYRTRHGNLWSESGIDTVVSPDFFDISSLDSASVFSSDMVLADWFNGFLKLTMLPKDKKDSKSTEANGTRYLFIVNGQIKDNLFVSNTEASAIARNPSDTKLIHQREMLSNYEKYVDFYSRCMMDRETVTYEGHEGLFEHKANELTLAMSLFNNNPFRFFANCTQNAVSDAAPFGRWVLRGDSLFLSHVVTHRGKDVFSFTTGDVDMHLFLADSVLSGIPYGGKRTISDGAVFADWISGNYVIHYGVWETNSFGIPFYTISKTQTIRLLNGVVTSSQFSPSSFMDDEQSAVVSAFSPCDPSMVYSVDDKQLVESVGDFKHPKNNPSYQGGKSTFRSWFLNNPLIDERAKDRLFRVRLAFLVNCKGEVGEWQVISKGKGELYEFANIVLELVKTMPHNWNPATDRKGNPVDCWQIMEFTVSNGVLTNGNYK